VPEKQKAINNLMWLSLRILAQQQRWQVAARTFGSAYRRAYDAHKGACDALKRDQELRLEIALGILGVVTKGTTSWIGRMVKQGHGDSVKEFVFDPIVTGVGLIKSKATEKFKKQLAVATAPARFSADPHLFQNDLVNAVTMRFQDAADVVHAILFEVNNGEVEESASEEVFRDALTRSSPALQRPSEINENELAHEMERALWAMWLQGRTDKLRKCGLPHASIQHWLCPSWVDTNKVTFNGRTVYSCHMYLTPGISIESRLRALGVNTGMPLPSSETIGDGLLRAFYAGTPRDFKQPAEVKALLRWAAEYQPKTFGDDFEFTPTCMYCIQNTAHMWHRGFVPIRHRHQAVLSGGKVVILGIGY